MSVTPRPISRRRALVLGGMGAAALATGNAGWVTTTGFPGGTPGGGVSSDPGAAGETLARPPELVGSDGRLQVELVAAAGVRLAGLATERYWNGIEQLIPGMALALVAVAVTLHMVPGGRGVPAARMLAVPDRSWVPGGFPALPRPPLSDQ